MVTSATSRFPNGSVFHVVRPDPDPTPGLGYTRAGSGTPHNLPFANPSFDIAIVEFDDAGDFVMPAQLDAAADAIQRAREKNPNGVLVVMFIHGWHHNAAWQPDLASESWDPETPGDKQFREFRRLLMRLALRERERNTQVRSIVGIYLGWNGDPETFFLKWLASRKGLTHLTFWDRLSIAGFIGAGAVVTTIRRITEETKKSLAFKPECPLVLCGHSMGALVLEKAVLSMLRENDPSLIRGADPTANQRDGVELLIDGQRVVMPDLLLAINSAADSKVVEEIKKEFEARGITKRLTGNTSRGNVAFSAPLIISATSWSDFDTRFWWPLAQIFKLPYDLVHGRIQIGTTFQTDGHAERLCTHTLTMEAKPGFWPCLAKPVEKDFKQAWHCLRFPNPLEDVDGSQPSFDIDLPSNKEDRIPHARYRLAPKRGLPSSLAWLFHVPDDLVPDHNDIFSGGATLLFMALIQISGAVMSLSTDIGQNFEADA